MKGLIMLETVFLNLIRGNRITNYLGLELKGNSSLTYSKDYGTSYLQLGRALNLETAKHVKKLKKDMRVALFPLATINPRKYRAYIEVNPALYAIGNVNFERVIEADKGVSELPIYLEVKEDFDGLEDLEYLVRISLIA